MAFIMMIYMDCDEYWAYFRIKPANGPAKPSVPQLILFTASTSGQTTQSPAIPTISQSIALWSCCKHAK